MGAPGCMIEAAGQEGVERVLAGVATRPVPAVVAERNRFGERHIEPEGASDARCDLGDFKCVRETRAHVVVGEDEDLRLSREATERARVQYPIAITLKTSAFTVRTI